jgi:toxin-antitoxin system PIN domain toxin
VIVFVVDTNLLLFAVNPDAAEHELALGQIEQYRRGAELWFLTWGIVYEFLRVSTHRAVFDHPLSLGNAWAWIAVLRTSPVCHILTETERHAEMIRELVARHPRLAGNPVHDLHTAALMLEHGVGEIRTADTDFHQFPFLRVVNPLASA